MESGLPWTGKPTAGRKDLSLLSAPPKGTTGLGSYLKLDSCPQAILKIQQSRSIAQEIVI